ncbi:phosphoenolpyruvate--protein phosphotransferase [Dasania marina]|uniref:phosphoenolpyruvate--protein phosphotransferase n=1 Tax=Dasania marina TaxID=471499 RepID=UPI0030D78384|tara:strand:- start:8618 stop:10915 length:2298 start_codon:yes stop_codon:yes gene_type:complete
MLESLRRIVQELNGIRGLQQVLDTIATRVRDAVGTEVCSVYLRDQKTDRYFFMATEGLNRDFIGKISVGSHEGLVGQVARREEPINLQDAIADPHFIYLPGIGEEEYKGFLGVPIIHQRTVLGVLVVQQKTQRRFDEDEEAFLVTISAQLAGVIAHAQLTGSISLLSEDEDEKLVGGKFVGVSGSAGVSIGTGVVVTPTADLYAVPDRSSSNIELELKFFTQCLAAVRKDIEELSSKLASRLAREEQALFDVYLSMLDDHALPLEVRERIEQGQWAQGAVSQVIRAHVDTFESMNDPYLKERATDVKDLGRRVLAYLQLTDDEELIYPDQTILIGEELTASMLAEVPPEKLAGLVSVRGSANSHVAIFARSLGIPTVMGVQDLPFTKLEGREIILDGYNGHVHYNPSEELHNRFKAIIEEESQLIKGFEVLKDLPGETTDKHRIGLWVNTGLMADVMRSLDRGAEGVGLFRSEVPFLLRERFPSEEEQRAIYREQLEAFAPRKVTMRTLDVGGDKSLSYFPIVEENPFLGWRGIRVTLDHPEIFLVQVRAMLKANQGLNNLRIMLPMISSVMELEEALELLYRAHDELIEELGVELELPEIGVMIEVPAAVYQARELAKRVNFLSVGSNDLTQYLLAVDRNNSRVASIFDPFHPAVLQALQKVADDAHAEGQQVSICGELAGNPLASPLLIAMGYDVLSMSATNLPKVKSVVRSLSYKQCQALLKQAMQMDNSREIRELLEQVLTEVGAHRMLNPVLDDVQITAV